MLRQTARVESRLLDEAIQVERLGERAIGAFALMNAASAVDRGAGVPTSECA